MQGYYVETWKPNGTKAEAAASFDTFDAAIKWFDGRKQGDPSRILRIRGELTLQQRQHLSRYGAVEPI